jgi:hypothetical protein
VGAFDFNGNNSPGAFIDAFTNNFLNANGHVELRAGTCANFGCGPSASASIAGVFYDPEEEGDYQSNPAQPDTLVAGGADLDDLRGDTEGLSRDTSSPADIAGILLLPVMNLFGRTQPIFVGPPASAGGSGGASLHSLVNVTAYRYTVDYNLFTHFILPAAMPGGDNELQVEVGGNIVPYTPGTLFDLTQYVPGGVSEFFLSGVDVEEQFTLDEISPFVSGLQFAANGAADIKIAPAEISIFNDYNADGVVDGADYVMMQKLGAADAYTPWLRDFGSTFGGGGASAGPTNDGIIPEPANIVLVALCMCLSFIAKCRACRGS